jgi:hypothetical protein
VHTAHTCSYCNSYNFPSFLFSAASSSSTSSSLVFWGLFGAALLWLPLLLLLPLLAPAELLLLPLALLVCVLWSSSSNTQRIHHQALTQAILVHGGIITDTPQMHAPACALCNSKPGTPDTCTVDAVPALYILRVSALPLGLQLLHP